jgi:hypothetical protein
MSNVQLPACMDYTCSVDGYECYYRPYTYKCFVAYVWLYDSFKMNIVNM